MTYQVRLPRGPHEEVLASQAALLCRVERHLHVGLAKAHQRVDEILARAGGKDAYKNLKDAEGNDLPDPVSGLKNDLKIEFLRRFGITGRQYNSVLKGLEGKHSSLREILLERISRTEQDLKKIEAEIKNRSVKIASFAKVSAAVDARAKLGKGPTKAQAKRLLSRSDCDKERFTQHQKKRKRQILIQKLEKLRAEASRNIPALVFGSKKLLRKRNSIHPNNLQEIDAWRSHWEASRHAGFMLIGSKDETAGCQSCIGDIDYGHLSLKLRLPNSLVSGGEKYLHLDGVELPEFGKDQICEALNEHKVKHKNRRAITYRFVRDTTWSGKRKLSAWRVCITMTVPVTEITHPGFETYTSKLGKGTSSATGITDRFKGAIGVDLNADHLAWAVIDRFGNPIKDKTGKISLPLRGKSSGHRDDIIGDASRDLVTLAKDLNLPLVLEKLDFKIKKQEISESNAGYARMLSSFAYSKIHSTIRRRAARCGVELVDVNPAYTSVIGRVNLSERYGLSVHAAAAVAIARRAAQYSERVSYIHGFRGRKGTLQTRSVVPYESRRHVWRQWYQVRKDLVSNTKSGSWPAASNATSIPPRERAYDQYPGVDVMADLEKDRLALEIFMPEGMRAEYRAAAPRDHDSKTSFMMQNDHV